MEIEFECLGCKLANKQLPVYVVHEDEHVICMLDHDPFNDGHIMILPKRHFLDVEEFDNDVSNAVMNASILISKAIKSSYHPQGITICQNGGIFNDLNHYHMHVIPRYEGQNFATFYSECEFQPSKSQQYFEKIASEMKEAIKRII